MLGPVEVHIRWMIRRDMPSVCGIEEMSFDDPWMEEDYLKTLRSRNCVGMVAEYNGDLIVGSMVYELLKYKVHLVNLSVHPDFRRRNVGTQMIQKLKSKMFIHQRSKIDLWVRESFLSAQLFFRKQDFKAIEVERNFYNNESAYLMRYSLSLEDFKVICFGGLTPKNRISHQFAP